jgi:eukaryotic-like serine/threonine-protein kinase
MPPTPASSSAAPSRRGPRTGHTIAGKYRLGALLGKGGRGEVYSALQIDLARDVAVKLLPEVGGDDDARARFLRETRITAEIRHPGIVQVYDGGVDSDGAPYCAMELLEGETLAERLERGGPLGVTEAVAVAAGLCMALQAVHDKGFLHRDVKPSNVFLARRPDGGADAKLIDFGIAKRISLDVETQRRVTTLRGLGAPRATALDVIVGTPRYLSPEQVLGGKLDPRCDVHALAITLYEMLSGAPPFTSDELTDIFAQIVLETPEPLAHRAPDRAVPAALDRAILSALAKDPTHRPPSAADFAATLRRALDEGEDGAAPASAPRRRRLALALAASLAATVGASALVAIGRRPTVTPAVAPAASPPPAPQPGAGPAPATAPPAAASLAAQAPPRATPMTAPRAGRRRDDLKTPY